MIVQLRNNVIFFSPHMKPQPSSPAQRAIRPFDVVCLLLGLIGGALWLYCNYTLPDYGRGLRCGDAGEYIRLTETKLSTVFEHSSVRVFGYPFFLAVIRLLIPNDGYLLATALIQFLLHIIGSSFLFFALRRSGLKIPYGALGLLFAYPALNGVNALTLTDGIATSFTSFMLGTTILLLNNTSFFRTKSIILGLLFGILISLRPSISTSMWPFLAVVVLCIHFSRRSLGEHCKATLKSILSFLFFYAVGCGPIYGHLVHNCYRSSGELCTISSYHVAEWVPVSFRKAIQYSRIWGIVRPDGTFDWGSTGDGVLERCDVGRQNTTEQLLSCYRSNFTRLPRHFFRRTLGIFDNRHLNPYAALLTSPSEELTLRLFSIVGLMGLLAAILHGTAALAAGSWPHVACLSFPLIFLGIQLNFHTETRYIFPIQPILFLLGLYSLQPSAFTKRWLYAMYLVGSAALIWIFINVVTYWDTISQP